MRVCSFSGELLSAVKGRGITKVDRGSETNV